MEKDRYDLVGHLQIDYSPELLAQFVIEVCNLLKEADWRVFKLLVLDCLKERSKTKYIVLLPLRLASFAEISLQIR